MPYRWVAIAAAAAAAAAVLAQEDPLSRLLIPPFSVPETHCETLACVQNDYRQMANQGPFNLSAMIRHEFGLEAQRRISKAFSKIRFDRPVVYDATVETEPIGFKLSAPIQFFGGRYDAFYEGIFVVEQGGFISMNTGITFPSSSTRRRRRRRRRRRLMDPLPLAAVQAKDKLMPLIQKAHRPVVTWAGINPAGMAFMTFERALVVLFGLNSIPSFNFLQDHGDVGILIAQRARLSDAMYHDVAPLIHRSQPVNPFKFSSVLKEFTLSNNRMVLVGALSLKPDCTDVICKLVQTVIPTGTRLQFKYDPGFVTVDPLNAFTRKRIQAGLGDVRFHEKFIIHDASLFLDLGMGGIFAGIAGSLLITPPENARPLRFRSEIAKGFPFHEYEMTLAMEGMYEQAFGIPFVHLGNIHGAVGFEVGVTPHTYRFGCELWLGKIPTISSHDDNNSTSNRVHKASGFVGFNTWNPVEVYFYAFLTNVTFQAILDTITEYRAQPAVKLPSFIGETGLSGLAGDDGVLISFTPVLDYTIPFVDPPRTIRAGLTIAARLSMLGVGAVADVSLDFMTAAIDLTLGLEPLSVGQVIQLSKSRENRLEGPSIRLVAGLSEGIMPEASMDGFASFFGMGMGFNGLVSPEGFKVSGDLKLFNWMDSRAELAWNLTTGEAHLSGTVSDLRFGFIHRLQESIAHFWKRIFHRRMTGGRRRLMYFDSPAHLNQTIYHALDEENNNNDDDLDIHMLSDADTQETQAVEFADGTRMKRRELFTLFPFRVKIDKMTYEFPKDKKKTSSDKLAFRLRLRRFFGGREEKRQDVGAFIDLAKQDQHKPNQVIQRILSVIKS